ncbi:2-keto-4-pentenoate hydratase/2-oxohepta-3-ene-1,7-dioic acid hydratase in catechol pathway [Agromyces sp. 3263]|uniref:fumarylacetoacetate hydrolase family protein n=1 Tax=Agromyces sp. 3263 TaxID=2817750 RepID=UPI002860DD3F|nr:fumarylacetoacetate hydrolase family protein [Agromyces sp. 3263]MDR6907796.1 2-keto-4-pentenoate hydratase/2-oxohepta-3-ene-1,7-dioic acid hydratase in catechol pathway [Agromyces sp. 3263]
MTSSSDGLTAPFVLVRFRAGDAEPALGLVAGERVRPIGPDELGAPDLNAFLAEAPAAWDRLAAIAGRDDDAWLPLADVTLAAPVTPRQVLQTGANYRTHVIDLVAAGRAKNDPRPIEELRAWAADMMDRRAREGTPYFFIGLPAAVVGDDVPLRLPGYSDQHDWELELAVVIGKEAFRVDREHAMEHVAGYTIVNDVTTRDLVFREDMKEIGTDWYRGKNAPGFLPTGPFLVPAPFVATPGDLHLELTLNGETMQDATTSDLLFDLPALIAGASQNMPLLPGDLLLTGSPAGNGIVHGRMLRDGDVMVGAIEGLGRQTVRAIAEEASR